VELPDAAAAAELCGKPAGFAVAAIQHFVDCVENDQTPLVTREDGIAAARVLAEAEQSAQSGLLVKVAYAGLALASGKTIGRRLVSDVIHFRIL